MEVWNINSLFLGAPIIYLFLSSNIMQCQNLIYFHVLWLSVKKLILKTAFLLTWGITYTIKFFFSSFDKVNPRLEPLYKFSFSLWLKSWILIKVSVWMFISPTCFTELYKTTNTTVKHQQYNQEMLSGSITSMRLFHCSLCGQKEKHTCVFKSNLQREQLQLREI